MNKVNHIKVNYHDYLSYYEKYGHNRLDKWTKIIPKDGKSKLLKELGGFIIEEEIFDGIETEYNVFKNENGYKLLFGTKNKTPYRFDIIKENDTIYHLSFSSLDNIDYHDLTNKHESLEVFNRLIWILKDFRLSLPNDIEFCIGFDDIKKGRIYEYMMKFIKNWEKRETHWYDTGWAIYFKL
ncbi:MAG: hypothetical protein ACOC3V_05360 [bacterium]